MDRARHRLFRPMPTRKVSDDLSREALGLIGLTTRKCLLEQLRPAGCSRCRGTPCTPARRRAAGGAGANSTASSTRCVDARGVGRLDARQVGRHVRHHHVDRPAAPAPRPAAASTASSRKSPWMKCTPSIGSIGSRSSAMMRAVRARPPPRRRCRPPWGERRRRYWLQAPGAAPRSTTSWPGRIRPQRLVDLLQLVGGAGAVALLAAPA